VTWAINEKGYSQRRACRLVSLQPKTYRYASTRPGDGALRVRLKELASQRRRFGYRRLGLLLARQGIRINRKKLYRLYKDERLTVRKRGGLGLVATMFIVAQLALILRWPLPSYVPWVVVAAVGAGTVLSYAILAEYFPKELTGKRLEEFGLALINGNDVAAQQRSIPHSDIAPLPSVGVIAWMASPRSVTLTAD
jgi:hypothetical protein